jgi:leader peptidase (prepilin peptidase)/N-methyltransferase
MTTTSARLHARSRVALALRQEPGGRRNVPARVARWAVVAALGVIAVTATGPTLAAIPAFYLAAVTPELMRIDLREHRLPNRLVVPGIGIGLLTWAIESLATGRPVLTPIVAGSASALFLLALCVFGGIGMGDVKLAAALGLASWVPFVGVLSPVIGFLVGGVASVVLIVRRGRANKHDSAINSASDNRLGKRMAFGPYLLAGFWIAVALVAWVRVL